MFEAILSETKSLFPLSLCIFHVLCQIYSFVISTCCTVKTLIQVSRLHITALTILTGLLMCFQPAATYEQKTYYQPAQAAATYTTGDTQYQQQTGTLTFYSVWPNCMMSCL